MYGLNSSPVNLHQNFMFVSVSFVYNGKAYAWHNLEPYPPVFWEKTLIQLFWCFANKDYILISNSRTWVFIQLYHVIVAVVESRSKVCFISSSQQLRQNKRALQTGPKSWYVLVSIDTWMWINPMIYTFMFYLVHTLICNR